MLANTDLACLLDWLRVQRDTLLHTLDNLHSILLRQIRYFMLGPIVVLSDLSDLFLIPIHPSLRRSAMLDCLRLISLEVTHLLSCAGFILGDQSCEDLPLDIEPVIWLCPVLHSFPFPTFFCHVNGQLGRYLGFHMVVKLQPQL